MVSVCHSTRQDFDFALGDVGNVFLLRLIDLTSLPENWRPDPAETPTQGIDMSTCGALNQKPSSFCNEHTTLKDHGKVCDHLGDEHVHLQRKERDLILIGKFSDKIRKTRNAFAHGVDVSISEVLNCYQKFKGFFSTGAGKAHTNRHRFVQSADSSMDILKPFSRQSSQLNTVCLQASENATFKSSRLLLSVQRELVGREDILKRLTILMTPPMSVESTEPHSTPRWPRVLLHGPPGIGKTAVVRELSCRLQTSHSHQHSFQATTEMTLLADINLFLKLEMGDKMQASSASVQPAFKEFLSETEKTFLLIFEDVREPGMVMSLLPTNNHCAVFTSPTELSWRELNYIPSTVSAFALEGLGEEDSLRLVAQVLNDNGCKELYNEIRRKGAEEKHFRNFLSKHMLGVPLAVRLVAFQVCCGKKLPIDFSLMIKDNSEASMQRLSTDEKAAGRVHVRGFYHLVRYALGGISKNDAAMTVCFVLSIFTCSGPTLFFLEKLVQRLNFASRDEVCVCLETLMKTGLVTKLGEIYSMHQVVQSHVRAIVSSSFKEVKESVIASLLQTFKSETILSTRTTLSDKREPHTIVTDRCCFSGQRSGHGDWQCIELLAGSVISDFLDKADSLQLSWKERNTCLRCLRWCYEHGLAGDELVSRVSEIARSQFMKYNQGTIAEHVLAFENDDEICETLLANWTYLDLPFSRICSDITRQIEAKKSTELIKLLHCGARALILTKQHGSVPSLFRHFDFPVESLLGRFEATANECFSSCALICVEALSACKEFLTAQRLLRNVIRAWLPQSKMLTIECHEEIVRAALRIGRDLSDNARFGEALELYDQAYSICNIDSYSQHSPDLALYSCYQASHILIPGCNHNPTAIDRYAKMWLNRALHFAKTLPKLSMPVLENLFGFLVQLSFAGVFGASTYGESSSLAIDAGNRLQVIFTSLLLERTTSISKFRLDDALALLLLAAGRVERQSDLDMESVSRLCGKLAQTVSPIPATSASLLLHVHRLAHLWLKFTVIDKCTTEALVALMFHLSNPQAKEFNPNPLSRTKPQETRNVAEPDPGVIRGVIDVLAKELVACGKISHAKVVQEAFRRWPPT